MITFSSLRKQLTFRDIFRQTELWGPILMTCHYPDWSCLLLVETNFPFNTTNQKHYQDLGSDTSSAWEFCSPQTLFRGETSGGVQKRWPRFVFFVLLKLTKKKNATFSFLDWNSLCGYYRYFKRWICQKLSYFFSCIHLFTRRRLGPWRNEKKSELGHKI